MGGSNFDGGVVAESGCWWWGQGRCPTGAVEWLEGCY
jgi:hypothetical protein